LATSGGQSRRLSTVAQRAKVDGPF
jgi:hypothetical protein